MKNRASVFVMVVRRPSSVVRPLFKSSCVRRPSRRFVVRRRPSAFRRMTSSINFELAPRGEHFYRSMSLNRTCAGERGLEKIVLEKKLRDIAAGSSRSKFLE